MTLDLSIRPHRLLPAETLDALADVRGLALVEIAGRDSVAASVVAVRDAGFTTLLPTVAKTCTEMGDRRAPGRAVESIREIVGDTARVLEPVTLGEPALWRAMNARFAAETATRFGVCSPCLACHTYLHLARVPLAWHVGGAAIVSGERKTHGGRIKLSQTEEAIDAATGILAHAGIRLVEPLRDVESGEAIAEIVGRAWDETAPQLGCVLSGNYVGIDGSVRFDEAGYRRYVDEFLRPVGFSVIDEWRRLGWDEPGAAEERAGEPDYERLVRSVLAG